MAKQRPKSPRARLFIALDLPDPVRSWIESWGAGELGDPALRPVPGHSLHITLAFLGYRPEREVERLGQVVDDLRATAPTVRLGDPVAKPSRSRARLFALPADSPGATLSQEELEAKLVAQWLHKAEKRPFWPHVTVARARPERRGSKRPARVSRAPGRLPQELLQPFRAVRVTLYRSELQPQGAHYTPLAQVELPAGGRQ